MVLVLVVDDRWESRELLEACLRHAGYDVATARTADEALQYMVGAPPTVIVCDAELPDRLWLTDEIRTRHPTTAIILASDEAPDRLLRTRHMAWSGISPLKTRQMTCSGIS